MDHGSKGWGGFPRGGQTIIQQQKHTHMHYTGYVWNNTTHSADIILSNTYISHDIRRYIPLNYLNITHDTRANICKADT